MTTLNATIRIGAQVDQAIAQLRAVRREVAGVQEQARRGSGGAGGALGGVGGALADMRDQAGGAVKALALVRSTLGGLAGVAGVGAIVQVARQLVQARMEAERLQSLLNLKNDGSLVRTGQDLAFVRGLAADLGQEFQNTAEQFAKFGFAAKGTRLEGQGVRDVFESVLRAATALRLDTANLNGVLLALQQIISKGKVSAEELRGQLGERLPGAVQIAARALGVTTQQLDKMLERGELIAEDFLPKFARELDKSLGDAPQQASRGLQAEINRLSTAFMDLKQVLADGGFAQAAQSGIGGLASSMANLTTRIKEAREEGKGLMSVLAGSVPRIGGGGPVGMLSALFNAVGYQSPGADELPGLVQRQAELQRRLAQPQRRSPQFQRARQSTIEELDSVSARLRNLQVPVDGSDNRFARAASREQAGLDANDAILARRAAGTLPAEQKQGEARVARTREVFDKELQLLQDKLQREQLLNQQQFDAGLRDVQQYLAERSRLDREAGDAEVRELQAKLEAARQARAANLQALGQTTDPEDRRRLDDQVFQQTQQIARIEADIVKAKRDQVDAQRAIAEVQRTTAIELQRALRDIDQQINQALGTETADQIAARVRAQLEPLAQQIRALGGDTAQVDRLAQVRTAQEQLNQSARDFANLQEAIRLQEAEIDRQVAQGKLTTLEAERQKFAARDASLAQLRQLLQAQRALAQTPEERNAVDQRLQDIKQLEDRTTEFDRSLRNAVQGSGTQLFKDVISGAKSAKDAVRDFGLSIIASIQDVIARDLGEQLMQSIFGSGGGAGGGSGDWMSLISDGFNFLVNGFHRGGIAGKPGEASFTRRMPAAAFAFAPRYHAGGIAGLRPGEVPAVLKVGEETLTEDDPRHIKNFRGSGVQVSMGDINISGGTGSDATLAEQARELQARTLATVNQWAAEQSRAGGILARRGS
jgi:tape measure domain-containing protein